MMKISNKRLNCEFTMPVFGMGSWCMGGTMERDLANDEEIRAAYLGA